MTVQEVLTRTIADIDFLRDMAPAHLEQIAAISTIRDWRVGETVFREGDSADHIYLVIGGIVSLEICVASAGCKQILTLGPGELLGWSALLKSSRYTARARAAQPTRLLEINVERLLQLCDQDPKLGYDLMRRTALALAQRLSATRMQYMDAYGEQLPTVNP